MKSKILFLLLVVALLTACGAPQTATPAPAQPTAAPAEPTTTPQTEYVEVLRLPSGGDWGFPSPFGFNRGPGYTRASYLFDTLLWRDSSGTIPWLATEWSSSEDGKTWTFTLRENVQWHDGQPLTAADVVFSVQYYQKMGASWFLSPVGEIESATAPAPNQVVLTLKRPFAPFIQTIAETMFILPKHIWEKVDDPKTYREKDATIGSGPYLLVEYNQAEGAYLFEANPDFFLGVPYVRRLEFVPTSDNLLALQNGEIGAFDKFGGVNAEMLKPFEQAPYQIKTAGGEWGTFLYFNLSFEGSPVQNVQVRQAIASSINRQEIVERILLGFGGAGSAGFLPPANPYFKSSLPEYALDAEKAQSLLAEAGYTGDAQTGWKDAQGSPLTLSVAYSTSTNPRLIEMLESSLKAVGIAVQLQGMDQATLDAAAQEGNYEVLLVGFGGLGGDPNLLSRNFASFSKMQGFSRARGYANPDFDALAKQEVGVLNPSARAELIGQMQELLAADLPALALYYTDRVVVFNAEVFDNWYFTPGGYGGGIPQPYNKHQYVIGVPTGTEIRK